MTRQISSRLSVLTFTIAWLALLGSVIALHQADAQVSGSGVTYLPPNQLANGSATAPAVSFATSPSTGVYLSAANTLAFTTNGVQRGTINSTGDWVLATPTSGIALTTNGFSGAYTADIVNGAGSGSSFGLKIDAGTTTGDQAFRINDGVFNGLIVNGANQFIMAASTSGATVQVPSIMSNGTAFTVSGCGTPTATGGTTVGKFTAGATTCNPVIAGLPAATNGWHCQLDDQTTAITFRQTANTTTTATLTASGAATTSDVVVVSCLAF